MILWKTLIVTSTKIHLFQSVVTLAVTSSPWFICCTYEIYITQLCRDFNKPFLRIPMNLTGWNVSPTAWTLIPPSRPICRPIAADGSAGPYVGSWGCKTNWRLDITPKKKWWTYVSKKGTISKRFFFIFQAWILRGCVSLAGSKNVNHETSFFDYFQGNPKS